MEDCFQLAASHLETLISSLTESTKDADLLYLYARYKQATVGPCNTSKPSIFNLAARKKWSCWNNLQVMTKEQAMEEYIEKIKSLDPSWKPESATSRVGMGVSVSILNYAEEDILKDCEKDIFDWCKEGAFGKVVSLLPEKMPMDDEGRTLLHWACDRGHLKIAKYLVEDGHDVNCIDSEQLTPLHYASSCDHCDIIALLLEHKADPTAKDCDDETPMDSATSKQARNLLKTYLNEHEKKTMENCRSDELL